MSVAPGSPTPPSAAPEAANHLLLVECQDQRGLIHRITGAVLAQNLNIVSNDEFVDPTSGQFFMRTEFSGAVDRAALLSRLAQLLPAGARFQVIEPQPKKIVVLATKEPYCLGDLLLRQTYGELNAQILAVLSNYNWLQPLAERFGAPYFHLPHEGLSREAHERGLLKIIARFEPDYIVLAKYMRILTEELLRPFPNRIINIHHSFLPAFAGAHPYQQAYDRGVKVIGATAHFVTEHLDEGPIIAQSVVPVAHRHSVEDMAKAGREIEKLVLARALKLVFEERVFVSGNKTIIFD